MAFAVDMNKDIAPSSLADKASEAENIKQNSDNSNDAGCGDGDGGAGADDGDAMMWKMNDG